MAPLYPWLTDYWPRFAGGSDLHHAIVLAGPSGIGKREFAAHLIQRLLCSEPGDFACGQCQDCHLFLSGSHPDVHVLMTEKERETGRVELFSTYSEGYPDKPGRENRAGPSRVISVEKIRSLIDRFYQSSYMSARRIALILPSDRMNVNASNALLKLLEEPPASCHFVLVTDQPGSLLPTIRSRCLVEVLQGPTEAVATEWLKGQVNVDDPVVQGAIRSGMQPLDILADHENGTLTWQSDHLESLQTLMVGQGNPVALAESLAKQDAVQLLGWLERFVVQLIRWRRGGSPSPWGSGDALVGRVVSDQRLFILYDKIGNYRRIAKDQLNLRFALEEVFILLAATTQPSR